MDRITASTQEEPSTAKLFPSKERWGWRFRNLATAANKPFPYNAPYPTMPQLPFELSFLGTQATRRNWFICFALATFVIFWFFAINYPALQWQLLSLGIVAVAILIFAGIWLSHLAYLQYKKQLPIYQQWTMEYAAHLQEYEKLNQLWQRDRNAYDENFRKYIGSLPEWGVLRPRRTIGRADIFGGAPAEWEALIVTLGASILGSGSQLSIIDFTQNSVANSLYHRSRQHGFSAWKLSLPEQQEHFNLLSTMSPMEVTDMLIEALHSDDKEENKEGRFIDARIIKGICQCISQPLTIQRIYAGLLILLRQGKNFSLISDEERLSIFDLFQEDYLSQIRQRLVALESQLHDLRLIGEQSNTDHDFAQRNHALQIVELNVSGATLNNDFFINLLAQRQVRLLRSQKEASTFSSVLLIAGVDSLKPKLLERLDNLSKRHGIRLIYLFEHLRRDALEMLGSSDSAVVFMRLGNPKEAEMGAEFIGRGYKFVMKGFSENEGENMTYSVGSSTSSNTSISENMNDDLFPRYSWSNSTGTSDGFSAGTSWGTNKGTSRSHERVYEFEVEPTFLQSIPPMAFLLVELGNTASGQRVQLSQEGGRRVQIGYCDPYILSQNRVSPDPLLSWEDRGR